MLTALASVGISSADATHLHDATSRKRRFNSAVPLGVLAQTLPGRLRQAERDQCSVILRPRPGPHPLIQLDDLRPELAERLAPVAFMALATSQHGRQAWVAMRGASPRAVCEALARRLKAGTGADRGASGAFRVPGSTNYKPKYAPAYPLVRLLRTQPGRLTDADELEALGLLGPAEEASFTHSGGHPTDGPASGRWPDYALFLGWAPRGGHGGPDRSYADFRWCCTAIEWGWPAEEVAERLMGVSGKAQSVGRKYAERTAAAAGSARKRGATATSALLPNDAAPSPG